MYNSNGFDANAVFGGGGGFNPSQAVHTESSFSPAKNRDSQALLPLTVKQISAALESSDGKTDFLIDGVDINNVTLVGMVFNKVERVTDVAFQLDDGTGRIDCNRWTHEAVDTKEMEGIMDRMYVRVHGHLKGFLGKKTLTVFCVRPLTEFDELTYHYVDCIYTHHYNTRVRGIAPPLSMPNSAVSTPSRGYQAAPSNQYTGGVRHNVDGLNNIDEMIRDYLGKPEILSVDRGIHVHQIANALNLPVERLKPSIEFLMGESLIYTTIDEDHYKSTANG